MSENTQQGAPGAAANALSESGAVNSGAVNALSESGVANSGTANALNAPDAANALNAPGVAAIALRAPVAEDGRRVHALVRECRPLDENSLYCNLLQCTHFSGTSIAALAGDELVGFISGYIIPERPDVLFVWQVAVSGRARGRGLGKQMLGSLLKRPQTANVRYIETTITPGNDASWGLFRSFAKHCNTAAVASVLFESQRHFGGDHMDEHLLRIGPLAEPRK